MSLKTITLELARNPGYPEGDRQHGYVFRAPLNAEGFIDRVRWAALRPLCTVKRIEKSGEVETGLLVINRRNQWVFSYARGSEDDETLFRLADHRFRPGEYVSITEHDGGERTFKVAEVGEWHADPAAAVPAL